MEEDDDGCIRQVVFKSHFIDIIISPQLRARKRLHQYVSYRKWRSEEPGRLPGFAVSFWLLAEALKDISESIFFSNWPCMNVLSPRIPLDTYLQLAARRGWAGTHHAERVGVTASLRWWESPAPGAAAGARVSQAALPLLREHSVLAGGKQGCVVPSP